MAYAHRHPPQSLLRERLHYDPETGIFRWKISPAIGVKAGDIAGTTKTQYVLIGIFGFGQIGAQRLAWIYTFGDIPLTYEIDHINRNCRDNRICNLRLATSSQQKMNRRAQSNNRVGLKGAYFHACHKGKKWRSQIKIGNRLIFLGYFHTAIEAHEIYKKAAVSYFGEFACLS